MEAEFPCLRRRSETAKVSRGTLPPPVIDTAPARPHMCYHSKMCASYWIRAASWAPNLIWDPPSFVRIRSSQELFLPLREFAILFELFRTLAGPASLYLASSSFHVRSFLTSTAHPHPLSAAAVLTKRPFLIPDFWEIKSYML